MTPSAPFPIEGGKCSTCDGTGLVPALVETPTGMVPCPYLGEPCQDCAEFRGGWPIVAVVGELISSEAQNGEIPSLSTISNSAQAAEALTTGGEVQVASVARTGSSNLPAEPPSPDSAKASPEILARGSSVSVGFLYGVGADTRSMVRARIDEGSASAHGIPFSDHARSAIRDYDPRDIRLPDLFCESCEAFHRYAPTCPECGRVQIVKE